MTLSDRVALPIVLYNIPGRTGINMTPATVARLFKSGNFPAIKEAAGSCDQVTEIRGLCDIAIVSGDDSLTLPFMSVGATGVISVLSNVAPQAGRGDGAARARRQMGRRPRDSRAVLRPDQEPVSSTATRPA